MNISGKTKLCGIIGDPIEHTLSPIMHNTAFEELNLDFVYVAFNVRGKGLGDAIAGVRCLNVHGLNVTMPHKSTIMNYLDEIETTSESIGAVNTILNWQEKLIGYNTDGLGAMKALENSGVTLEGKKLLLLGAGGAGKAIAFHASQEIRELTMLNRDASKARIFAEFLRKRLHKNIRGNSLTDPIIQEEIQDSDILINATSIGMYPDVDKSLVNPDWLRSDLSVMDIIYNPIETKLTRDAKLVGARIITGITMLIYQGAASFEIWTDHDAPVEAMKEAVLNKLREAGTQT